MPAGSTSGSDDAAPPDDEDDDARLVGRRCCCSSAACGAGELARSSPPNPLDQKPLPLLTVDLTPLDGPLPPLLDGLVLVVAPLPPANLANAAAEGPPRPGVGGPEPRTECARGEVEDDKSKGGGYGAESPAPVNGGESS